MHKSDIERSINDQFQKHQVNNPQLQEALIEVFNDLINSRKFLDHLTTEITKLQKREEQRRSVF
ncbi:hypothetical protein ABEO66_22105 [Bacillus pacificus]|uniref:hypothetical protein n=1 Tax=Bacillus pacificus TaxID=2026187 RepID=UPI003D22AF58